MIVIKKLTINGFGSISAPDAPFEFSPDKLNLVVGDNEVGKTTLAEALFAGLYGLNADRRRTNTTFLSQQDAWRPLKIGAGFGVAVEIDIDGQTIDAKWDFERGSLTATDRTTGRDMTDEFKTTSREYSIGDRIFELSAGQFRKVCFIEQGKVNKEDCVSGIQSLVQRFSTSESGDSKTAGEAIGALEKMLDKYPGTQGKGAIQIETEIKRLIERRDKARETLARLKLKSEEAELAQNSLARLKERREEMEPELRQLRHFSRKAELNELRSAIRNSDSELEKYEKLVEERNSLEYLKGFPVDRAESANEIRGRLKSAAANMNRLKADMEAERRKLDDATKKLKSFGKLGEVTQRDVRTAENLLIKLDGILAERDKSHKAVISEAEILSRDGIMPEELEDIRSKLKFVPDQVIQNAANYKSESAQMQLKLQDKTNEFKETGAKLTSIRRKRSILGGFGMAAVALGLLAAAAGGALTFGLGWEQWILKASAAAGGALVVVGLIMKVASSALFSGETAKLKEKIDSIDQERADQNMEFRRYRDQVSKIAEESGFNSPDKLAESATKLRELERRCAKYYSYRDRLSDSNEQIKGIENEIRDLTEKFSLEYRDGEPRDSLEKVISQMKEAASIDGEIAASKERLAGLQKQLEGYNEDAREQEKALMEIFRLANIETGDIEDGLVKLQEARKKYGRYTQLVEAIRDKEKALPGSERISEFRRRADELAAAVENTERESPALASLKPDKTAGEYNRAIENLSADIDSLANEIRSQEKIVDDALVEWEREGPDAQDELADVDKNMERALRHQAALSLAIEELRSIQSATHRRWAEDLNKRADAILTSLTPSLHKLRFEENLKFHVFRRADDAEVTETSDSKVGPKLSRGQIDQLYFAVRLGIAEFLGGRGVNPPILLDDPFVNFDDSRFENAMRFLAEKIAGRHQVILLSCHSQRFEWLRRRNPELFDRSIRTLEIPGR